MALARVARRQLVQHREVVVAAALGAQSDLVAVVLDLRLVAQRRLDLRAAGGRAKGWAPGAPRPQQVPPAFGEGLPATRLAPWTAVLSQEAPKAVAQTGTATRGAEEAPPPTGCNPALAPRV